MIWLENQVAYRDRSVCFRKIFNNIGEFVSILLTWKGYPENTRSEAAKIEGQHRRILSVKTVKMYKHCSKGPGLPKQRHSYRH